MGMVPVRLALSRFAQGQDFSTVSPPMAICEVQPMRHLIPRDHADWLWIPSHVRDGLERYLVEGIPTGSFLQAVLENNFQDAVMRADALNELAFKGYVLFLQRHAHPQAWGSKEAVAKWIDGKGEQCLASSHQAT